jgi:hypothetical protein
MRIIHPLQVIDGDQRFTHRRGSSGVLLSSSIQNLYKEKEMATMLFNGLVSLLGNPSPSKAFEKEMLTYAKTEYGSDWQFAYHYMLTHNGHGPKMGVHN